MTFEEQALQLVTEACLWASQCDQQGIADAGLTILSMLLQSAVANPSMGQFVSYTTRILAQMVALASGGARTSEFPQQIKVLMLCAAVIEQHASAVRAAEMLGAAIQMHFPDVNPEILRSLVEQLQAGCSNEARFAEVFATFLVEFREVDSAQRQEMFHFAGLQ